MSTGRGATIAWHSSGVGAELLRSADANRRKQLSHSFIVLQEESAKQTTKHSNCNFSTLVRKETDGSDELSGLLTT